MVKIGMMVALLFCSVMDAFEKLPPSYQIAYGDTRAPVHVVEYFSFSCPKCLQFVNGAFADFKREYINTGKVYWAFHPDPADKQTLLAMICLKELDPEQKRRFLEEVAFRMNSSSIAMGLSAMQAVMESFRKPLPDLGKPSFWQNSEAFLRAFDFLVQEGVVSSVPTVEIDGEILDAFPSKQFLESQVKQRLVKRAPCE